MTQVNPEQPGSGTEAPAAPGAEVDTGRAADERQGGAADEHAENAETSGNEPEATSPELEHLKETINKAEHAADEALAPQRE
jgi:hypothetical protein